MEKKKKKVYFSLIGLVTWKMFNKLHAFPLFQITSPNVVQNSQEALLSV